MNIKNLTKGLIKENPTFVQLLGMCPTLAVTTAAINGLGMGLATTVVLIMSNVMISMLRKSIPDKIRIPAFIVIIASAVTIVSMLMEAYVPSLFESLGLFIPLIVVNCIILARAEAFAFSNGILNSALDGIGMGLGFTLSLTILGTVRELLGGFSFFGTSIFNFFMDSTAAAEAAATAEPMLILIQPPGAFLTLALLLALYNQVIISKKRKQKAREEATKKEAIRLENERLEQQRKEMEEKKAAALAKAEEAKKAAEEAKAKEEAAAPQATEAVKEEAKEEAEAEVAPAQEVVKEEVKEEKAPETTEETKA